MMKSYLLLSLHVPVVTLLGGSVYVGRHPLPLYFWLDEHSVSVAQLCCPLRIQNRFSHNSCPEGAHKLVRETNKTNQKEI